MEIINYIETELYILVPVLYALGSILKRSSAIDDRWIPIILGIMGMALATVYKFGIYAPGDSKAVLSVIFAGLTQGILCAAASVYANNVVKQMKKSDNESDSKGYNTAG